MGPLGITHDDCEDVEDPTALGAPIPALLLGAGGSCTIWKLASDPGFRTALKPFELPRP